jgi:hypothetical protein
MIVGLFGEDLDLAANVLGVELAHVGVHTRHFSGKFHRAFGFGFDDGLDAELVDFKAMWHIQLID